MLKVGLIGLGFMGKTHLDIYSAQKEAKVTAVADCNLKRLAGDFSDIGGNLGPSAASVDALKDVQTFEDPSRLIKEADVDLIDICLPTDLHVRYVLEALKTGRHVFCEKPLGLDGESARRVVRAARTAKGFFMTGLCIRFWPEYEFLKGAVDKKRYGKVVSATFRRVSPVPTWSSNNWLMDEARSGGAALDLHIHDTDFVIWLLGKPAEVRSVGQSRVSNGIDHIITQFVYKKNVMVVAEGAWLYHASFPFSMSFTVGCEHATVNYNSASPDGLVVYLDNGKLEKPKLPRETGHFREIVYFLRCVRNGTAPNVVTPKDAAIAVEVVRSEIESARTSKQVKV